MTLLFCSLVILLSVTGNDAKDIHPTYYAPHEATLHLDLDNDANNITTISEWSRIYHFGHIIQEEISKS